MNKGVLGSTPARSFIDLAVSHLSQLGRVALIGGGVLASAAIVAVAVGAEQPRIVGVAHPEDPIVRLTRQVAALEARVRQLESGQTAIENELKKPDVQDDDDAGKSGSNGKSNDKGAKQDSGSGSGSASNSGGKPSAPNSGSSSGSKPDSSGKSDEPTGPLKDVFPTMTLRAPFVVVDAAGKPIFRVNDPSSKGAKAADRGVYIYGNAGTANFELTTVYSGGKFVTQTDNTSYSVSIGALDNASGMKFRAQNKTRAYAGIDTRGRGLIGVFSEDEQLSAALQTNDAGKGLVAVMNGTRPVAFLTQSEAHPGGGNVTVANPEGGGVFSAGYDGEAGTACVNHKQSLHCLGIGLPLQGGQ